MINTVALICTMLSAPQFVVKGNVDMVNEDNHVASPITVYVSGSINEGSAQRFASDMNAAHETGQPVIPIVIRSYGGNVYSLLSMVDVIKNAKVPVATIVVGKAMSAGAVLLSCGTEGMRYASPSSTIMIHEVSSGTRGKVKEIKADAKETSRLNELLMKVMSKNIGKAPDYFTKQIHTKEHADWYITPRAALKHNLINHIGTPGFTVKITVRTEFE